jgi:hypothetical protein
MLSPHFVDSVGALNALVACPIGVVVEQSIAIRGLSAIFPQLFSTLFTIPLCVILPKCITLKLREPQAFHMIPTDLASRIIT